MTSKTIINSERQRVGTVNKKHRIKQTHLQTCSHPHRHTLRSNGYIFMLSVAGTITSESIIGILLAFFFQCQLM